MSTLVFKWLWVAVATGLTDVCWTLYVTNAAAFNKIRASFYSVGILLMGSSVVVEYVADRVLVIPAAIGAFIGTWLTLKFKES